MTMILHKVEDWPILCLAFSLTKSQLRDRVAGSVALPGSYTTRRAGRHPAVHEVLMSLRCSSIEAPSPAYPSRAAPAWRAIPIPSAVPPPTLCARSGIPALLAAPPSGIERSLPVRLLVFGPSSPCTTTTVASADFCSPLTTPPSTASPAQCGADEQISRGKARDLRPTYPPHLRPPSPGGIGLRVSLPSRPPNGHLICGSCSSGQGFAYSFLPTLPHGSAVAVQLEVPATKAPRGLPPPSHSSR
jgi:hypothetical protein